MNCILFAQMLSSTQRARLETETINFFKQAIVCHQDNQLRFANVLCDVMRTTGKLYTKIYKLNKNINIVN